MRQQAIFRVAAMVAAMLAFVLAGPAVAAPGTAFDRGGVSFATACHSASGLEVGFETMASRYAGWTCENRNWEAERPVAWLRFEASSWQGEELPRYFFSRIARFEAISFATLNADGTMEVLRHLERDAKAFPGGPVFQLELPEVTSDTEAVLVRIERPHSIPLMTEARLTHDPEDGDWSQLEVMILAMVIGMLVLPLLFDISFYVVLREHFVPLHAMMVVAMMTYVIFGGGLISVFIDLPIAVIAVVGPLAWAIGCGVSALFLVEFLEDDAQSTIMRRLTLAAAFWCIVGPGFFALQFHTTQGIDDKAYFYSFVPVIIIITAAITEAVLRGSRGAQFVAFAWAPIILASLDRLLRGLGVYVGPSTLDISMYLATGVEVIIISLAIADRFLALRRERDEAVTEALMLERLSERDPLTGLMNRRALDERFPGYHREGFETFALVDLDRFKQINDTAGHLVGDTVLKVVASTLQEDENALAFRLGGEEFFVLLRGDDSRQRAEHLRRSISLRVANEVPELEQIVTASVGLIEIPQSALPKVDFEAVYSRADQLMYEAKENGRNRMISERLQSFHRRETRDRRREERRKRFRVG